MAGMDNRCSGWAMKLRHTLAGAWQLEQSYFVMRSNIDRGSRINVGSVTRLRSAPGRSCDIRCMTTGRDQVASLVQYHLLLPCSGSMTVSSSTSLDSSLEPRLPERTAGLSAPPRAAKEWRSGIRDRLRWPWCPWPNAMSGYFQSRQSQELPKAARLARWSGWAEERGSEEGGMSQEEGA
jgi:hypothetical protein